MTTIEKPSEPNKLQLTLKIVKTIFTPVALLFIGFYAWQARETLSDILIQANILLLVTSIFLWAALHLISPLFSHLFFKACNHSISYRNAFNIHSKRLPAKYLPGGIWHSVVRAVDYHEIGIDKKRIGLFLIVESLLALAVSSTLGGYIVSQFQGLSSTWLIISSVSFWGGLLATVILPIVMKRMSKLHVHKLSLKYYCLAVVTVYCYWIIAGVSFIQFVNAFPLLLPELSNIETGAAYIFSWSIGFLAIFSPQGVGVSEFVLSEILQSTINASTMLALFATYRVVILLGDTFTWLIAISMNKK